MIEPSTASKIWERAKCDRNYLLSHFTDPCAVQQIELDDKLGAVNIGIILRECGRFELANVMFRMLLELDPDYMFAHYEYSHSLLRSDHHRDALHHAQKAAAMAPDVLRVVLQHASTLANLGDIRRAQSSLNKFTPMSITERQAISVQSQFCSYLKEFPRSMIEAAIAEISLNECYYNDFQVENHIISTVLSDTPFFFVRLGDGEGAWTFMSNSDEAEYSELYEANRRSFLNDWFGSEELLGSDPFHDLSKALESVLDEADIIGIPDPARMRHEYRLVSQRGVPSSVNVVRKLGLMDDGARKGPRYTSNNIHMHLEANGFFTKLWRTGKVFGVITSYRTITKMLREQARIQVQYEFLIPGDSRNYWIGGDSRPLVQFPEVLHDLSSELERLDLKGVVFLVAAGFVGKHYLRIIKRRGGIALDIGGVANKWAASLSVV